MGVFAISSGELLSSVLFLRNYVAPAAPVGWYTGHLWSLAVEEHFYLLWPGLLVLWGVKRARWGCAALSLLIAAWRVAEFRLQIGETVIPGLGFYTRTDIQLDALLWGCWFALMASDPHTRERLVRLLSVPVWLGALVAALAVKPPLAMLWQSLLIPCLVIGTVLRSTPSTDAAAPGHGHRHRGQQDDRYKLIPAVGVTNEQQFGGHTHDANHDDTRQETAKAREPCRLHGDGGAGHTTQRTTLQRARFTGRRAFSRARRARYRGIKGARNGSRRTPEERELT